MARGIYINEIGNRYGKLVVIERAENIVYTFNGRKTSAHVRWICQCDCGNTKVVFASNLRDKHNPVWNCGCENIINESGKIYGKWTVLNDYRKNERNKVFWHCQCSCGNESYVQGTELRNGHSKSCGKCMPNGEASFHGLYTRMIANAKKRNIFWDLKKDDVRNLTSLPCFYCGESPKQIAKTKNNNGVYIYNGLDRVDSNLGYVLPNVVPCCKDCNYAKRVMSVDRFKEWIGSVYNHFVMSKS